MRFSWQCITIYCGKRLLSSTWWRRAWRWARAVGGQIAARDAVAMALPLARAAEQPAGPRRVRGSGRPRVPRALSAHLICAQSREGVGVVLRGKDPLRQPRTALQLPQHDSWVVPSSWPAPTRGCPPTSTPTSAEQFTASAAGCCRPSAPAKASCFFAHFSRLGSQKPLWQQAELPHAAPIGAVGAHSGASSLR